jgi:hypothetical protein
MEHVLVTVSKGIIDQVVFFDDASMAVRALSAYVKIMSIENDDAAVYSQEGFVASAKHFLNESEEYLENKDLIKEIALEKREAIYIIGNPQHRLGFMVASPDDPLGYDNPVEALSDLGQMRKDAGGHLKLYRLTPVNGPVAHRDLLEEFNIDLEIEDFDYSLVDDYLEETA